MAKSLGYTRKLYLKTGSDYAALTGETTSSISLSADMIEVSDKSATWKEFLAGYKGGTVDATIFADEADTQQVAILNALHNGTEVDCFLGELGSDKTPANGDAFKALVASVGETYDTGSAIARNVSLQITGEVTHYPALS